MDRPRAGDSVRTRTNLCRAILLGTVLEVYTDSGGNVSYIVELWMWPSQPLDLSEREIEGVLEGDSQNTGRGNLGRQLERIRREWNN